MVRFLLSWNDSLAVSTLWKITRKKLEESTEILKNVGDVLKIDGHHPQSEELEEAAIESDADIVMVPPDED